MVCTRGWAWKITGGDRTQERVLSNSGRLLERCRAGWGEYLFPVSSGLQQILLLTPSCLILGGPRPSVPSPCIADPLQPNPTQPPSASPHCPLHVSNNTFLRESSCCSNKLIPMEKLEQCLQLTLSARPPLNILLLM